MKILGYGKVQIGDNFHSGTNCQIITSFHNYDRGEALPYDSSNISKDVIIKNNVWLGNNVIILGGGANCPPPPRSTLQKPALVRVKHFLGMHQAHS